MTPENKNVDPPLQAERRPRGRITRALAAASLTGLMLLPGALHEQAAYGTPAVAAEKNPDNDPIRLQTHEAFKNVTHDELYHCEIQDVVLGESIDMDEYGNKIPLTPILGYSMTVTEGTNARGYPPQKTSDGATVEVGWERYGSASNVRVEFQGDQPKEPPDPHSFRSSKASLEAEAEGQFHQEIQLDPSVDGPQHIDLLHAGKVKFFDSRAQARGENPPSLTVQKYCGNVTVMMKDGNATVTNVNLVNNS